MVEMSEFEPKGNRLQSLNKKPSNTLTPLCCRKLVGSLGNLRDDTESEDSEKRCNTLLRSKSDSREYVHGNMVHPTGSNKLLKAEN